MPRDSTKRRTAPGSALRDQGGLSVRATANLASGCRAASQSIGISTSVKLPGSRGVDCGHDERHVRLKGWPLLNPNDDDRNAPAGHILLMPHVLVGGQEDLEARVLGHGQQVTVLQRVPMPCAAVRTVWPIRNVRIGTGVA